MSGSKNRDSTQFNRIKPEEEYANALDDESIFEAIVNHFGGEIIDEYGSYRKVCPWQRGLILKWLRMQSFYNPPLPNQPFECVGMLRLCCHEKKNIYDTIIKLSVMCFYLYTCLAIYLFASIDLFQDDNFNILGGVDGKDALLTHFDELEKRISNVEDVFAYLQSQTKGVPGTSKHEICSNTKKKL